MTQGVIAERFLDERRAAARIACPPNLIPAPGQYLLAHDPASNDPLAVPLFPAGSFPDGFLAAPPLPRAWTPGLSLSLRGPLGRGFHLPASSRRVALAAMEGSPAALLALLAPALAQGASIVLVCDSPPQDLPDEIEIQPLASLEEVCRWADYLAFSAGRANWIEWRARLARLKQAAGPREAQGLIHAPMPCAGLAECGACALPVASVWKWVCRDGPVFNGFELLH
ncbi:MAG: Dihydroorotate dehydrogenase B (NAD(+)), electron transfer subunit [Anaerolineales bacterium]|nr:Dihydroorotate dehydrogenase B (NAD(+)), electron transfer subunit [Anaerolineales bacterium]